VLLKLAKKKVSPNVSNNLDVEPEVTGYTSSQAMQETSRTNQPRTPDGEECIAVSDGAVSNLLLDSDDECGWDGTVNHVPTSESDNYSDFEPGSSTDTESESDSDIEVLDLEGEELLKSLLGQQASDTVYKRLHLKYLTVVQSGSLTFSQTSKHRSHWCAK
jgi:hypothetical protein